MARAEAFSAYPPGKAGDQITGFALCSWFANGLVSHGL